MTLDYFKDLLFDVINESDQLDIVDLTGNDQQSTFTIRLADGSTFLLHCTEEG